MRRTRKQRCSPRHGRTSPLSEAVPRTKNGPSPPPADSRQYQRALWVRQRRYDCRREDKGVFPGPVRCGLWGLLDDHQLLGEPAAVAAIPVMQLAEIDSTGHRTGVEH